MQNRLVQRINALSQAFLARNFFDMKRIASDSISEAVLQNDYDLAKVSVISYCLYKMTSKEHFVSNPKWKFISNSIVQNLDKSAMAFGKGQTRDFKKHLKNAIDKIEEIDQDLSHYAKTIFEKAKTKQASTAYALGMSLSQAASLTGANKKELQKYIGITRIHDEEPYKESILERLSILKNLFRK